MRLSLIEVLKNLLIMSPWVRTLAKKSHRTGILNNEDAVANRVSELIELVGDNSLSNDSVIEFGPGQNSAVIITLYKHKMFRKASVVDIVNYFTDDYWHSSGVEFLYKDSSSIQKSSIDFIYAYDVLEHVKKPKLFLRELRRIIRIDGKIFLSWDFRDHLHLDKEESWFDMHKYSRFIWNMQMSNRSSYVNRITIGEWVEMFGDAGFEISMIETFESTVASNAFEIKYGVAIDPTYRAKALLRAI